MMSEKKDCGNCKYQMTGFDGGFCGLPMTCECKIYGETENRKNCNKFEKRLTKSDLLMRITKLEEENEQLHHELQQTKEYLQTKIDECKNHKKMKEIVFGVEEAVGYEKALLQFQKGLKRRLNDE